MQEIWIRGRGIGRARANTRPRSLRWGKMTKIQLASRAAGGS
jgi:hypothetical protein